MAFLECVIGDGGASTYSMVSLACVKLTDLYLNSSANVSGSLSFPSFSSILQSMPKVSKRCGSVGPQPAIFCTGESHLDMLNNLHTILYASLYCSLSGSVSSFTPNSSINLGPPPAHPTTCLAASVSGREENMSLPILGAVKAVFTVGSVAFQHAEPDPTGHLCHVLESCLQSETRPPGSLFQCSLMLCSSGCCPTPS